MLYTYYIKKIVSVIITFRAVLMNQRLTDVKLTERGRQTGENVIDFFLLFNNELCVASLTASLSQWEGETGAATGHLSSQTIESIRVMFLLGED